MHASSENRTNSTLLNLKKKQYNKAITLLLGRKHSAITLYNSANTLFTSRTSLIFHRTEFSEFRMLFIQNQSLL